VGNPKPILGGLSEVESIIHEYNIDHIIVAIKEPKKEINLSLKDLTERHHIAMSFHPTQKLFENDPYKLKDIAGLPLLSTTQQQIDSKPFYDLFKRIIDFSIAVIGISITLPLWIFIGLIIKINSSGPIFFTQSRIGLNGKPFKIFKFRTMKSDSKKYAHCPINKNDTRITSFGLWLRKLSLDEIPQLINVLKGEMSLVGPRPEMPFIVDTYESYEKKRLSVIPGITGLWQVSPARNAEIHDNPEYDLLYIEHRDLSLDILILILTIVFVFRTFTH
jgi:lipopolysaccharide/colanic/teichoic acid biosynthesis glycosyltransferase